MVWTASLTAPKLGQGRLWLRGRQKVGLGLDHTTKMDRGSVSPGDGCEIRLRGGGGARFIRRGRGINSFQGF